MSALSNPPEQSGAAPGVPSPSRPVGRRPVGLTVISILWVLLGLGSAFQSFIKVQVSIQILFTPSSNANFLGLWWLWFIAMGSVGLVLDLLMIVAASGFWRRKPWSYRLGLVLPLLGLANSVSFALWLYTRFPTDFDPTVGFFPLAIWLFWTAVIWSYLRRPYVKEYLRAGKITNRTVAAWHNGD